MKFPNVIRVIVRGGVLSGQRLLNADRQPVVRLKNSKTLRTFKAEFMKLEGKVFVLNKKKAWQADGRKFVKREYKKYLAEKKKNP